MDGLSTLKKAYGLIIHTQKSLWIGLDLDNIHGLDWIDPSIGSPAPKSFG